jgi:pimeloyl-ACP methyl ester carboxylesterase
MPGLVPGIPIRRAQCLTKRDGRDKPGHDEKMDPKLTTEDFMVPALDPGIDIYVRNKRPADMTSFRPERTVLFVHGATYPAHATFDLALDGLSWMDYIAGRGYDVYLLDIRGYGKSMRPKEMAEPPDANPPIVRTATAVKDIAAVVDFIRTRRNIPRLVLLGWSWGTFSTPTYAIANAGKVVRLVLYSPIWIGQTGRLVQSLSAKLGAYRTVTREQAHARWYAGVPEEKKAAFIPAAVFDAWWQATCASDPDSGKTNPPAIRAPNGVVQDCIETWWAGKPYYDPAEITVPALLVTAAWDTDVPAHMARTLFPLLTNSPGKRLVELPEGTHSVMMEANRLDLFAAVQTFLDEGDAQLLAKATC